MPDADEAYITLRQAAKRAGIKYQTARTWREASPRHGRLQVQNIDGTDFCTWEDMEKFLADHPDLAAVKRARDRLNRNGVTGQHASDLDLPEAFEDVVRGLTGEPLLTPRQAAYFDAAIERLRKGRGSMSAHDRAYFERLARQLGIPDPES